MPNTSRIRGLSHSERGAVVMLIDDYISGRLAHHDHSEYSVETQACLRSAADILTARLNRRIQASTTPTDETTE